jgi:hypothetical protein
VSYGVVFPSVLLAHSIPCNNAAVRGLVEGAQAALEKVDQIHASSLDSQTHTPAPALSPA